jgi:hypothetical protein
MNVLKKCIFLCFAAGTTFLSAFEIPETTLFSRVHTFVPATECYVLFLLESRGDSLTDALSRSEKKLASFLKLVQKKFPEARCNVTTVSTGIPLYGTFYTGEKSAAPTISKVLVFTLPPDENMAIQLADSGTKANLELFSGKSNNDSSGAIYYGICDADRELDKLFPTALKRLLKEAENNSRYFRNKKLRLYDLEKFSDKNNFVVEYKSIKIRLPGTFVSADKKQIPIVLVLKGKFRPGEEK